MTINIPKLTRAYAWQSFARKTKMPEDPAALPATFVLHCLELVRRYITTFDRQYRNTLLNLRQYRKDFAPPQPAPEPNEPKNLPSIAPETPPPAVETPRPQAPKTVVRPVSPPGPTLVAAKRGHDDARHQAKEGSERRQ